MRCSDRSGEQYAAVTLLQQTQTDLTRAHNDYALGSCRSTVWDLVAPATAACSSFTLFEAAATAYCGAAAAYEAGPELFRVFCS